MISLLSATSISHDGCSVVRCQKATICILSGIAARQTATSIQPHDFAIYLFFNLMYTCLLDTHYNLKKGNAPSQINNNNNKIIVTKITKYIHLVIKL